MELKINSKQVAETIAAEVEQATGKHCEAFSNDTGSLVLYNSTTPIARVTPLYSDMFVAPLAGPYVGDLTKIPFNVLTLNGIRDVAHAMDAAISHALSAAMCH